MDSLGREEMRPCMCVLEAVLAEEENKAAALGRLDRRLFVRFETDWLTGWLREGESWGELERGSGQVALAAAKRNSPPVAPQNALLNTEHPLRGHGTKMMRCCGGVSPSANTVTWTPGDSISTCHVAHSGKFSYSGFER